MKINCYTTGLPADQKNLRWYLSKLGNSISKSITFNTSNTIYISHNLSSILKSTKMENYLVSNGQALILVSGDEKLIDRFKSNLNVDLPVIEVSDITLDLSDSHLVSKLQDTRFTREEVLKCDCEPEVDLYNLVSQATGLRVEEVKNVVISLLGVTSILLMEKANEDCKDPVIEVEGLGYATIEDGKPLLVVGEYGVDKFTNLQLSADQMLYNLINTKNQDRLNKVRGDSNE